MGISFFKVSLLLANAYLSYRAWTPPVPHKVYRSEMVKEDEKASKTTHSFIAVLINILYTTLCLTEALVLIAIEYPNRQASPIILQILLPPSLTHNRTANLQALTTPFVIGSDHELITTGLYAYIRHPSYTGVHLHYVGTFLCHLTKGAWLRETGVLCKNPLVSLLLVFYLFITTARAVYTFPRSREEDVGLKKEFGEKWEVYSKRVRYRMIPGVF
ncbi:hypothetical protein CPB84DRAFT_1791615 [Gymnopilus junonius]|uniref:Protein-S-isoprenylcysteine O-methyltransferase n=1 Tax=Gymnopilus junonius TaxID=109634 RepID=A0A9P5NGA8_GYMJU|nr:hypothetical protein CPB84DRAFT_1791615 [Gymnopilus junonius]